MATKSTQHLRSQCASRAKSRLTEKYKEEFSLYYAEELAKVGIQSRSAMHIVAMQQEIERLKALVGETN